MPARAEDILQFVYQIPIGLAQTNAEGQVAFLTPQGVQILMQVAPEIEIVNIFDTLSKFAPEIRQIVQAFPRKRGVILEQYRCQIVESESQERGVFEITVKKLGPDRLLFLIYDITRHADNEDEALLKAQMVSSIVENIRGQQVYVLDNSGRIVSWNISGERLSGFTRAEMLGKDVSALLASDEFANDAKEHWRAVLEVARQKGVADDRRRHIRKDGGSYWAQTSVSVLRNSVDDPCGFMVVSRDITEELERERELVEQATTDPLTGALNRRALFEKGRTAINAQNEGYAVALLDLDHFKALNDAHGHAAGDAALKLVVEACRRVVRKDEIIARFGGEEFIVLLPGANAAGAARVSEAIREAIADIAFEAGDAAISITTSVGFAVARSSNEPIEAVIERADAALYRAKSAGRNRVAAAA